MIPNNPTQILVDNNIQQWTVESGMVDVTATNAYQEQGKYILLSLPPDPGQVIVVTAIARYCWQRINVAQSSEYVQMIPANRGNNAFLFEPVVGDGAGRAGLSNAFVKLAAWTTAAGATRDDIKTSSGSSLITNDPDLSLATQRGANVPYFVIPVGTTFKVLFSLVPVANNASNVLPGRFVIGASPDPDDGTQRVDYACVALNGYKMAKQYYDSTMKHRLQMG